MDFLWAQIVSNQEPLVLPYASRPVPRPPWLDCLIASAIGLLAGALVGLGIFLNFAHVFYLASAGAMIGLASALAARRHAFPAVLVATFMTFVSAMATAIFAQYAAGHWPLSQETIDHYGDEKSAAIRLAIGLLLLVCAPAVTAGVVTSLVRAGYRAARR